MGSVEEFGERVGEALRELLKRISGDADPRSGRMLAHSYEPGVPGLWEALGRVLGLLADRNMLDFTVYPSVARLSNELSGFVLGLFHAPEGATASFTSGGTESIMLAAKAARDAFTARRGPGTRPVMVVPATAHPAFHKAAHYLGYEARVVPVDPESLTVDIDAFSEALQGDRVAFAAVSAPNYPYGTLDPVDEAGEAARDAGVWLHVDACIGFILPFAEMLGEPIPPYDFRVEGVSTISTDMHKYGYAPKGSSLLLHRSPEHRGWQWFIYARWPGYPLVNEAVLSSRPLASLAAAWLVARALGVEGYKALAEKVLRAREKLVRGAERLGFRVLGRPVGGIVALAHEEANVFLVSALLRRRGWILPAQPGWGDVPPSLHATLAPVHEDVVDELLGDLEWAVEEAQGAPRPPERALRLLREKGVGELMDRLDELWGEGLVEEILYALGGEASEELIKAYVDRLFTPRRVSW